MAELKIKADSGGGTVSWKGPATTTSNAAVQLTLPQNDGDAGQYLKTDGSGALSWATVSQTEQDASTGDYTLTSGNLVMATAGKGIDFSAAAGSAGGSTSALLDDYEEGTFTPSWTAGTTGGSYTQQHGHYVKTGNLVNCWIRVQQSGATGTGSTLTMNMPFTSFNNATSYGGTVWYYNGFKTMAEPLHVWLGGNSTQMQFHTTTGGNFGGQTADNIDAGVYFHVVYRSA